MAAMESGPAPIDSVVEPTEASRVWSTLSAAEKTKLTKARYSALRTGIIRLTPETMKCKLYCRGSSCQYCSSKGWSKEQMAINGLYSTWITENILAMARPTTTAIEEHDIIKQFKKAGIVAVFNLQCQNEHSFCGPPLHKSGFSYDPELFMSNNSWFLISKTTISVYHYNFAIPDFEFCSMEIVMDMVKVMSFSLSEGKVAVHCHAGLGRTGTIIACYLVLAFGMEAEDALNAVRSARPKSVQSAAQVEVVEKMEDLMQKNARVLPIISGDSISSYFVWQNAFLPNEEARRYPHVPKLVFEISQRVLRYVFEPDGVSFEPSSDTNGNFFHNVHSCTFGTLQVEWKNVFTKKGRAQNRYVVNILARIAGFPYERDQNLIQKFQSVRVADMCKELNKLDVTQLLQLLHSYMILFRKPLASKKSLISWFELYSLERNDDEDWHCLIFFLCNVLSYLTIENYDVVTELITYWLLNDVHVEVKNAVHAHMRGLFARNLREQEKQARLLHSSNGSLLSETPSTSSSVQ